MNYFNWEYLWEMLVSGESKSKLTTPHLKHADVPDAASCLWVSSSTTVSFPATALTLMWNAGWVTHTVCLYRYPLEEVHRISMWVYPRQRGGERVVKRLKIGGLSWLWRGGDSWGLLSFKGKCRWGAAVLLQPVLSSLLDMYGHQRFLLQAKALTGTLC